MGLDGTLLYRFPTCIKDPCMKVPSKTHILCTFRTDVGTEIEADTEIDADAFKTQEPTEIMTKQFKRL